MTSLQKIEKAIALIEDVLTEGDLDFVEDELIEIVNELEDVVATAKD